jgi:hypothetical protein
MKKYLGWYLFVAMIVTSVCIFNFALKLSDAKSDGELLFGLFLLVTLVIAWAMWWEKIGSKWHFGLQEKLKGIENHLREEVKSEIRKENDETKKSADVKSVSSSYKPIN